MGEVVGVGERGEEGEVRGLVLEFDHLEMEAGGARVGADGGSQGLDAVLDGVAAEVEVHAVVRADGMEKSGRLGTRDSAAVEDQLVESQWLALLEPPAPILQESLQVQECRFVDLKKKDQ